MCLLGVTFVWEPKKDILRTVLNKVSKSLILPEIDGTKLHRPPLFGMLE